MHAQVKSLVLSQLAVQAAGVASAREHKIDIDFIIRITNIF
jgi:hypothetical protein